MLVDLYECYSVSAHCGVGSTHSTCLLIQQSVSTFLIQLNRVGHAIGEKMALSP